MEVSAGNSGPGCSTISHPPSFYDPSFTTGALNTGADTVASFSSRGPITLDWMLQLYAWHGRHHIGHIKLTHS